MDDEKPMPNSSDKSDLSYVTELLKGWIDGSIAYGKVIEEFQRFKANWLFEALVDLINSNDIDFKCVAAKFLLKIRPRRAMAVVLPLLESEDASVRWTICNLLEYSGDKRATKSLARVLRIDPDGAVRHAAAVALMVVGDDGALPALEYAEEFDDGTDNEGRRIRDAASEAIRRIYGRSE